MSFRSKNLLKNSFYELKTISYAERLNFKALSFKQAKNRENGGFMRGFVALKYSSFLRGSTNYFIFSAFARERKRKRVKE